MSKKRSIEEASILDQIAELINKSKTSKESDEHKTLLNKVKVICEAELNELKCKGNSQKVKKILLDKFGKSDDELKSLIEQVEVTKNAYEEFDYHRSTDKQLTFGDLSFRREYNGDNEGEGSINVGIHLGDKYFELMPWDNEKDILSTSDMTYEDYPDLLTIYKGLKFKTVKKQLFLDFVIAIYDEAMNDGM